MIEIDQNLFHFVNQTLACGFLDFFTRGITLIGEKPWVLVPFWLILMIKGGRRGRLIGWFLIPLLIISDMVPTYVLKPLFERPRPFAVLEGVRLLSDPDSVSQFGFPSNHMTNMTAVATFLYLNGRSKLVGWSLGFLCVWVGFSRVYVGVHYPFDVLGGFVLGLVVGWGLFQIQKKFSQPPKTTYT